MSHISILSDPHNTYWLLSTTPILFTKSVIHIQYRVDICRDCPKKFPGDVNFSENNAKFKVIYVLLQKKKAKLYVIFTKAVVAEFCFAKIKSDPKCLLLNKVAGV